MFPKLIMVLVVAAFASLVWRRGRVLPWSVLFLLSSIFFSRIYWRTGTFTLRLEALACLLVFLTYAYDLWRNKTWPALDIKTLLVLALFPAMILPSVIVSPSPLLSLKKTLIYVPYLLGFLGLTHFLRKKGALAAAWDHFFASGVLALGISVLGLVLFMAEADLGMMRMALGTLWLRGTFVIPNILGSTAVLVIVAGFLRLISLPPGSRARFPVLDLGLVLSSICIATSMTRSAWLCAVLGVVGVCVYAWFRSERKQAFLGLAIIGLTLVVTYGATSNFPIQMNPIPPGRSLGEFGEPGLDTYWKPTPLFNWFSYRAKTRPVVIQQPVLARRPMGSRVPGTPGPARPRGSKIVTYTLVMPAELSLTNRWATSLAALKDWRSSPIIGRGTESLAISRDHAPMSYISSTWVSILHDWGLVGLGLHLAFLVLVFLGMVRAFRRAQGPPAKARAYALILFLGLSTVMYQFATTMQLSIFWVLLALYTAASSPSPEDIGPEASAPSPA